MKYFALFVCFLCLNTLGFSQQEKHDTSVIIGGPQTKIQISSNNTNAILGITSQKDSFQNLIITSSQGNLQKLDGGIRNGLILLSDLKNGKVSINVFRKVDTGLLLLNYKTFEVAGWKPKKLTKNEKDVLKLTNKPEITIDGYSGDSIPLQIIRQATKFTINKPYEIIGLTILVGCPDQGFCSTPKVYKLNSANFDDYFKKFSNRCSYGCFIELEDIKIVDNKGKFYKLNDIVFWAEKRK